jgi:hypothetical protein
MFDWNEVVLDPGQMAVSFGSPLVSTPTGHSAFIGQLIALFEMNGATAFK